MTSNYRPYVLGKTGELQEMSTESFARCLGVSGETAQLFLRGISVTKSVCEEVGTKEDPPLVWNYNMPASLIKFVCEIVMDEIKGDPDYSPGDFSYNDLYEDDGKTLKFK